jgi:cyclase
VSTLRVLVLIVVAVGFLASGARARAENGSIETVDLGGGLAMLVGRGGNVGVSFGPDGALLVDDKFAPLAPALAAAVAELGASSIRFVLNTHWHGDHTGANEAFGTSGALIVGHANVRRRLAEDQWNAVSKRSTPASPASALPVVTFEDGLTVHVNGRDIELHAVGPAHTDGDAIVVFGGANLIHMGDVFFNGFYPYIDLASGGSIDGMIRAAAVGLAKSDAETRIIPGHGPLADKASLSRYRAMLVAIRDAVHKQVQAGRTVDQVLASHPSVDFDEAWGGGFMSPEDFIRIVYASLSGS